MLIDGHLDLAYLALLGRDLRAPCADDAGCVSLPALRDAGVDVVLATIFTGPDDDSPCGYAKGDAGAAEAAGFAQLEVYEQLEQEGEVTIVRTADDLDGDRDEPRLVLLMEGADPIRDADAVAAWFERGLRMVGLSWHAGTRYAGGNASHGPLTPAGTDVVAALDDLGIVHDASHLSDDALDGLLAHARGRIVATHSNCRALMPPDQRHLRDDQITAIAARDGIVGLNLFGGFLATERRATLDDCLAHVEHVAGVMGHRRGVALGSDMDGGFGPDRLPVGVDHPSRLGALGHGLRGAGWTDDEVGGFESGNWLRFLRAALPVEHARGRSGPDDGRPTESSSRPRRRASGG